MSKFVVLMVLILLVVSNLVYARPEDETVQEWAETKRTKQEDIQVAPVVLKPVSCELKVLTVVPDFPIYFVEDRCLDWGLSCVPNPFGTLYCKLGFWNDIVHGNLPSIIDGISPNQIYGIFSATQDRDAPGFQYCSDL